MIIKDDVGIAPSTGQVPTPRERLLKLRLAAEASRRASEELGAQSRDGDLIPLSSEQESLWLSEQLHDVGGPYNLPMIIRLQGHLDSRALTESLQELARRHESLRTCIVVTEGIPHQVVDPNAAIEIRQIDLSSVAEVEERERQYTASIRAEQSKRFDLKKGPLLRAMLVRLAEREHVLLLTMHHVLVDGWSFSVLNRDLASIYEAYARGGTPQLCQLELQYADYAIWQRKRLKARNWDSELRYWRTRLAGAPSVLQLPLDRPRPAVASFRGGTHRFEVPLSLHSDLMKLSREAECTLFMLLLAAYQILLATWSGEDYVAVGSPWANREHRRLEEQIGFFVKMLVLDVDLSGNPTFRQVLERVKEGVLGAFAHRDLPFDKLVNEVSPDRNRPVHPLFQATFALQNYPEKQVHLPDLRWTWTLAERFTTPFDLSLFFYEHSEGLTGVLEYAADLFDRSTIQRFQQRLSLVLSQIVTDPDCLVRHLKPMSTEERRQLINVWNDTEAAFPSDRCVHELISERARKTPGSVALIHEEQQVTYSELECRSNQLAHHLQSIGVGANVIVAVSLERSPEVVVALLGVLKAGGAYLPLDPSYPADRLQYQLSDAKCRIVLTQSKYARTFAAYDGALIALESEWYETVAHYPMEPPSSSAGPHTLAYIIYTSGSTGKPKGVCIPHEPLCNQISWITERLRLGADDVVLQKTPLIFDASVWEVFAPLVSGSRLLLGHQEGHRDPVYLAQTVAEAGVTVLQLVPSMLRLVVRQRIFAKSRHLKHLCSGGEALPADLANEVLSLLDVTLHNLYGPTETCIQSVVHSCRRGQHFSTTTIPIGRPVWNTRLYVLDDYMQLVPIGSRGELYIGGTQVAQGYLNRPDLTNERFVDDPFDRSRGGRLYRTGDLVRYLPDGSLEFLGRNDHQVKIRGFRIEVGEIEAVLRTHPAVQQIVVSPRQDIHGESALVAYIVSDQPLEEQALFRQIRDHSRTQLPAHMVPSAWIRLKELPVTPSGKVDLRALPQPTLQKWTDGEVRAPSNDIERALERIWAEFLGCAHVGIDESFFDLGGHSLLAVKLLHRINQVFDSALTVADFYRSPTIDEFARRIAGTESDNPLIDFSEEVVLDDTIMQSLPLHSPRSPCQYVLLTGATGFIGRFLLWELIERTQARIYCLVRASSMQSASIRLKGTLMQWGLWRPAFEERLVAIAGDLRQPRLGMDAHTYETLARKVDAIYHCGTSMNHLETYSMARTANVEGVKELIKLAADRTPKVLNYVSTLSVFGSSSSIGDRIVCERTPINSELHFAIEGYVGSKWVGEGLCHLAQERGIPSNVFRVGLVWADTKQGRYDEFQREFRTIKSALIAGMGIEGYQYQLAPIPVDTVARSIVLLAARHPRGNGIFHISGPERPDAGLFERINKIISAPLPLLSHYQWIAEVRRLHEAGQSLPVVPLVEYAFSMDEQSFLDLKRRRDSECVRFSTDQTRDQLGKVGVGPEPITDELLALTLKNIISRDKDLHKLRWLTERTSSPLRQAPR